MPGLEGDPRTGEENGLGSSGAGGVRGGVVGRGRGPPGSGVSQADLAEPGGVFGVQRAGGGTAAAGGARGEEERGAGGGLSYSGPVIEDPVREGPGAGAHAR